MKKLLERKELKTLIFVCSLMLAAISFVTTATAVDGGVCGSGAVKMGCQAGVAEAITSDQTTWYCVKNNIYSNKCYFSENAIPDQADFGLSEMKTDTGDYGDITSGENGLTEPIKFANTIITFSTTIIGIWFLINIILQGIKIINNSKDPKAFNEAVQKIILSIAGIALVALAYVIAGWVSAQLFGSTEMILNPSI